MGITINNPSLGGATPAGSNTQVQFNDGGAFGGSNGLTFNKATNTLQVGASISVAGAAVYSNISSAIYYLATTSGFFNRSDLGVYRFGVNDDIVLARDTAAVLAQRNGVNNQTYRLYKSFTDASNYTRSAWRFDSNGVELAFDSAGTGDTNGDITFTPKGTGRVRYGTHSVLAAETITGFIEIKDASGTLRKLAVIS